MIRTWLYRYDWVRDLKDYVRPYVTRPHEFYLVLDAVRPRTYYDIGAAVGDKVLTVLRRFPQCTVVAFEPHPDSFAILRARTQRYRRRVDCFPVAVSNHNGMQTLRTLSYADASSFYPISAALVAQGKAQVGEMGVPTTRLDSFLAEPIDLLKIDVEGHEYEVLDGARVALGRTQHVFLEILDPPRGPDNRARVPALLRESGFTLRQSFGQDHWWAR